jgi:hypothetical protein
MRGKTGSVLLTLIVEKRHGMIKLWKDDFKNIRLESARKHHLYPATGLQHLVATDAVRPAWHEILVQSHEPPTLKRKGPNSYLWQKKKVSEVSGLL